MYISPPPTPPSANIEPWNLSFFVYTPRAYQQDFTVFPIKATKGEALKTLTLKKMLQRLPIALAQVKVGNTPEKLLWEIRQIIYYLYQEKEITKSIYNNIINSIKV